MNTHASHPIRKYLMLTAVAALGACADEASLAPDHQPSLQTQVASASRSKPADPLSTLYHATVGYKNFRAAINDGFDFLHGCESRGDEGPVGTVYVHFERLSDGGIIDPQLPEGLIYQPKEDGSLRLVGVEFAVAYDDVPPDADPPTFMGQSFHHEDEFQVWGLHVWLWSYNPEGLFAETNPLVTCN
jgi:hypothetical protein